MSPTDVQQGTPLYPMARDLKCPWHPAPEIYEVQRERPVTKVHIWDGTEAWLVTRFEDVRFVLADRRFSVDIRRPGYPRSSPANAEERTEVKMLLGLDNPAHNFLRRMQTGDFRIRRVEDLRPRIQQIVEEKLENLISSGPPADLVEHFALPIPSTVISEFLGVPYEDHQFFEEQSHFIVSSKSTPAEAAAAVRALKEYTIRLVQVKNEAPSDDFLSHLAVEQLRTGNLTPEEIADQAFLLLVAGHETTANMISFTTLTLLKHPDQLAMLMDSIDDPRAVARATEELLRFLDVAHFGRRRVATEDVVVGGQLVKAGEGVIAAQEIADRDPSIFDRPDRLDLGRDAKMHMAFGYGIHQCLGQPLARVELQVVLTTLFPRLRNLELAVPMEELNFLQANLIYGIESLPVRW
jgi:cytochrome P450